MNKEIESIGYMTVPIRDMKLLLSFVPKELPDELAKGLDPTFYHTLTYEGDIEILKKLQRIKQYMADRGE